MPANQSLFDDRILYSTNQKNNNSQYCNRLPSLSTPAAAKAGPKEAAMAWIVLPFLRRLPLLRGARASGGGSVAMRSGGKVKRRLAAAPASSMSSPETPVAYYQDASFGSLSPMGSQEGEKPSGGADVSPSSEAPEGVPIIIKCESLPSVSRQPGVYILLTRLACPLSPL